MCRGRSPPEGFRLAHLRGGPQLACPMLSHTRISRASAMKRWNITHRCLAGGGDLSHAGPGPHGQHREHGALADHSKATLDWALEQAIANAVRRGTTIGLSSTWIDGLGVLPDAVVL